MPRGGKRTGAGRPTGKGKFGEPTKAIRVPVSMVDQILSYAENKGLELPLYSSKVAAGFPSPADDHMEGKLDLNSYLIKRPSATFFVRVTGDSMIKAGIHAGDILVVDRSITAENGKIVIAALDGELTVKRLHQTANQTFLMPENDNYPPIEVKEGNEMHIWGVVTSVVHKTL